MERHEEPVGDDLWQDIKSRLPEPQAPKRVATVWRRYAAAAAVALAVLGVGDLFWHGGDDTSVEQPAITKTAPKVNAPEPENNDQNDLTSPDVDAPVASLHIAQAAPVNHSPVSASAIAPNEYHAQTNSPSETVTTQATVENDPHKQPEEQTEQPVEKPTIGHINATPNPNPNATAHTTIMPARKRMPVSLEFYASNTLKPQRSSGGEMAHFYSGVFDYHLFGSIQLYDSIYPPVVKHKTGTHHMPYSLGVSVRVPLTERLALTSGLVYTRLKSNFSTREQTLHYLGVPLGMTYTIWGYKRFSLYAVGGVQADFNLKATSKEPSLINSYNIDKDRVQFSALAGPGFQLDMSQDFSIYVEPTARYYFDNGSSIDNYFKDKPWNININAGLRLTLQ